MADFRKQVSQRVSRVCSRLLLFGGAAIFLVGGKVLYEIKHISFLESEAIGIFGGALLMLLGGGIAISDKTRRPAKHIN
jgi:hypothetical protein